MYSNSSSYLGGASSSRPGQHHSSYQQQISQQPAAFNQQINGAAGPPPLQVQFTGFPGQTSQQVVHVAQQQPQLTGYPPQPSYSQNPTSSGQPPDSSVMTNRTSQTSSQIAQSFQTTGRSQASSPKHVQSGAKIPKIRLSFLTAQDQAKFEQLFKSAVGDGQALDGWISH